MTKSYLNGYLRSSITLKGKQFKMARILLDVADIVENSMLHWDMEKGATHFSHWFQPMTGITAEKHDSFISPDSEGTAFLYFPGKELVSGDYTAYNIQILYSCRLSDNTYSLSGFYLS